VRWVYVEAKIATVEELYVAVTIDPVSGDLVALAGVSQDGTAGANIARCPLVVTATGVEGDFAALAEQAGATRIAANVLADVIATLARTAIDIDATLVEVHPLGVTRDGRAIVLDAKIAIDDNALARHPDLARLRQMEMEEDGEGEVLAADRNRVNYMSFDGDIGVIVNGAGLALATHDMIVDAGGRPANFMDIRTTASSVDIARGIDLVLANPATRVLLVNVHGGGMQRCDTIVEGLAIALKGSTRRLPLVVRLEGQNADFARARLANFQRGYTDCPDMGTAVATAVAQARS
jgi:succinyl-CoA synthetase beta subunit